MPARRPIPAAGVVTRFSLTLPSDQGFTRTGRHVVTVSPNGANVVYVALNGCKNNFTFCVAIEFFHERLKRAHSRFHGFGAFEHKG